VRDFAIFYGVVVVTIAALIVHEKATTKPA